jgi:hypothetical protein
MLLREAGGVAHYAAALAPQARLGYVCRMSSLLHAQSARTGSASALALILGLLLLLRLART